MPLGSGEVCRVTIKGQLFGSIAIQGVYHLQNDDVATYSDSNVAADMERYLAAMYTPIAAVVSSQAVYDEYSIENVSANTKIGDFDLTPALAGTGAGDQLPSGVAFVARGLTNVLKTQGRKFIPGLLESGWDGEEFITGVLTAMGLFVVAWVFPYEDAASSRTYIPGVWRKLDSRFTPFTSGIVNTIAGYQRRRKEGRGI